MRVGHPMRRGAIGLLALGILVATATGPAGPASAATLSPVADTYVDASAPAQNFGGSTTLRIEGNPERITYLRFDPGGATSAVLKLNSKNNSNDGWKVYAVANDTWGERVITYNTKPELGALIGQTGPTAVDRTYTIDVSAALDGGFLSLALVTDDDSGLNLTSKESSNPPRLIAPAPARDTVFTITKVSTTSYRATSELGTVYNGSLKSVVEQSVLDLDASGGGRVQFLAGTYDLGSEWWELYHIARIVFAGAGMNETIIRNQTSATTDTEPFDFTVATEVTIRDMTVHAGGSFRSTSDAIDFDAGNGSLVENVKVTASRARGIVFDGKGGGWTADNNVVRNCVITGVPSDGIELLASSNNLIQGCTVTDTVGHGIQITKASVMADQPSKTSDDNMILGNVVTNSGQDGINVNSGNRNLIQGNTVTDSADDTAGRDGIRISGNDSIACDDNVVRSNTATDNQAVRTQKYGLHISTSLCHRTVVDSNNLAGNLTADIRDVGAGTIYMTSGDTQAPTAPATLTATAASTTQVDLAWPAGSDNVGVTGYRIHRDGSLLVQVPGDVLAHSDTNVLPGSTHVYGVSAVDAAGLESPVTLADPVTTPGVGSQTDWVATDDAYVSAASPSSSYGNASALRADTSPVIQSYLRFVVSSSEPGAHTTVLRLYANSSHNTGVQVRSVAPGGWTEAVTYNTAPAVGDVIATSGPYTAGAYVEIDLGTLVTGDGTYELAITGTTSTATSLSSSEGANPPHLVLLPA